MQPENPIGNPFIKLNVVESTNNYAMRQVQAQMAEHGATWFAHYQNAGKGQRGKAWKSEPGQNIMISVVLQPASLSIDNQFILNITVALACFDFFNRFPKGDCSIKWPNDIYWKDRKAGGILIENILQGHNWKYAIAGMGININQTFFSAELPNAVSLKQITGNTYQVTELAKELCVCLEHRWQQLRAQKHNDLFKQYSQYLYKAGETVTFKKNNKIFNAVVAGVNKNGDLLLNTDKQTPHAFGSIEWILPT